MDRMRTMEPMPPEETLRYVQEAFASEFMATRREQPLATNRAVIMSMLENPVWGTWGKIGSYQAARKVLDRECPGWAAGEPPLVEREPQQCGKGDE